MNSSDKGDCCGPSPGERLSTLRLLFSNIPSVISVLEEESDKHPFLSLLLFSLPSSYPSFFTVLSITTFPKAVCATLRGPSVTREHALFPVPEILFHPVSLVSCLLSCYEALLSRLGSSVGPQHNANIKDGKEPRDIMVHRALGIAKPRLRYF